MSRSVYASASDLEELAAAVRKLTARVAAMEQASRGKKAPKSSTTTPAQHQQEQPYER